MSQASERVQEKKKVRIMRGGNKKRKIKRVGTEPNVKGRGIGLLRCFLFSFQDRH